jgi:hypothetical protein
MGFLYRGVHARHPQLSNARRGIVIPGDVNGVLSPEEHNLGGLERFNPYTSWTAGRKTAERFRDLHGPGGVLLRVPYGAPAPEDTWSWVHSPDEYFEGERLLRGIRMDIEVVR